MGDALLPQLIQIRFPEIPVGLSGGEHVIGRDQDLMGDRHRRALVSTPRLEAADLQLLPGTSISFSGRYGAYLLPGLSLRRLSQGLRAGLAFPGFIVRGEAQRPPSAARRERNRHVLALLAYEKNRDPLDSFRCRQYDWTRNYPSRFGERVRSHPPGWLLCFWEDGWIAWPRSMSTSMPSTSTMAL